MGSGSCVPVSPAEEARGCRAQNHWALFLPLPAPLGRPPLPSQTLALRIWGPPSGLLSLGLQVETLQLGGADLPSQSKARPVLKRQVPGHTGRACLHSAGCPASRLPLHTSTAFPRARPRSPSSAPPHHLPGPQDRVDKPHLPQSPGRALLPCSVCPSSLRLRGTKGWKPGVTCRGQGPMQN